jgi:phage terminase small subunit
VAKPKVKKAGPRRKPGRKAGLQEQLKQKRFVAEYLVDQNATQAAIRAGYSAKSAGTLGHRLYKKLDIREAIEKAIKERLTRAGLSVDRVLSQLESNYAGACVDRDWTAANKATELEGRHLGMFAKKFEVDVSMSLEQMIVEAGNQPPKPEEPKK